MVCLFASIVIRSPLSLKMRHISTPISTYAPLYFIVSSTLKRFLRPDNFLFRSKQKLVEHSTINHYGEIQHRLLNEKYSTTIEERLLTTPHRKKRAISTQNALEGPLLSQPEHSVLFQTNLRLQIHKEPTSNRRTKGLRRRHAKHDPIDEIQSSQQPFP